MRGLVRVVIVVVVAVLAFATPVGADPNPELDATQSSEPTSEPTFEQTSEPTFDANIVNGDSSAGFNPGVVFYVIYHKDGTPPSVCGGTAISSSWILTAAHCVYGPNVDRVELIEADTVWSYQSPRILVTQISVHPGYNPGTGAEPLRKNDLALLRLQSATATPVAQFAEALGKHELTGQLEAYGWGQTESGSITNTLQKTTLSRSTTCASTDVSPNDTDCWRSSSGGSGQYCHGDSGTGGFQSGLTVSVVSYGSSACDSYSVTTRIAPYAPWITATSGVAAKSTRVLPSAQSWWGDDDAYQMVSATATGYVFSVGGLDQGVAASLGPAVSAITDVDSYRSSGYRAVLDEAGRVYTNEPNIHFGELVGQLQSGERATGIAYTKDGGGYWIFTSLGRAFTFGNAVDYGDLEGIVLNGPVVDAVPTASGNGYYMVGSDGGVFSFGDAAFYGSMGGLGLNSAVNGLVPDPDGVGYWLVAGDGGVFAFKAPFKDSVPAVLNGDPLQQPIVGMVAYGDGYLMVAGDGGIFNFSNKVFYGSLGNNPPASPIVSVSVSSVPG